LLLTITCAAFRLHPLVSADSILQRGYLRVRGPGKR
jgi:hypothetical protein